MTRNVFTQLKPYVERFPTLAIVYRTLRDAYLMQHRKFSETPYGFRLIGPGAMQTGTFEPEETALIQEHLDRIDVFVDIGANIGFYTCLALSAGKYTIAVEPLRRNLDSLYANLAENGWRNVEVYPVGLASQPGLATLYGEATGASLVSGWAGASPLLKRTIPLTTLDILMGERFCGKNLFIKVDVEGAEFDLLQGAARTLAMSPAPVWMVEIGLTEHYPAGFNPNYASTFAPFA
jgi:FkbM family methyltransferase